MMDRRAFLRRLGFGTVAAAAASTGALDIERLLWRPDEKKIFIPPAPKFEPFQVGDVFTIEGRYALHPVTMRRLPMLQRFVITATVDGSTDVVPFEAMRPIPLDDGPYANGIGRKGIRDRQRSVSRKSIKSLLIGNVVAVSKS